LAGGFTRDGRGQGKGKRMVLLLRGKGTPVLTMKDHRGNPLAATVETNGRHITMEGRETGMEAECHLRDRGESQKGWDQEWKKGSTNQQHQKKGSNGWKSGHTRRKKADKII